MAGPLTEIQERAIDLLREATDGIAYRDLVTKLAELYPQISRAELTTIVGELPKSRGDAVWRPRPGFFAYRVGGQARSASPRKVKEVSGEPAKWPERPLPNRVENLRKLGFVEVGSWEETEQGLECHYRADFDPKRALFAYVIQDNVTFVGRPERSSERARGQVLRAIRSALSRNRPVQVYALFEWHPCEHLGLAVNVGAGIEDELVERMQPPWNSRLN